MPLRVEVIVEGHGEVASIRALLERIWYELLKGDFIEVIPWRSTQGRLCQKEGLSGVVKTAAKELHATERTDIRRLLLIMIDTEGTECPKTIAAERTSWAREVRSDTEIVCVMPNPMFETWFVAAAASLRGRNDLPVNVAKPTDPEKEGLGKTWMQKHLPRKYKETVDKPRFVAQMDLNECEGSSRSFRKLVKELRARLPGNGPPPTSSPPSTPTT